MPEHQNLRVSPINGNNGATTNAGQRAHQLHLIWSQIIAELKAIRASQEKLLKEMEAMRTDMRQSFHALSTGKIIPLKGDAVPKKPEKTEQEKKKRKCKTCRKCAKDCTVCTHRCGCQPRAIVRLSFRFIAFPFRLL